jgi:hypothetical protein
MGSALVRFATCAGRDAAIGVSPTDVGDSILRFVAQHHGINRRSTILNHDIWVMLLNYPLECWDVDTVSRTFVPYDRFLVWNKNMSNRAIILVKFRAYNVDTLPMSIVVIKNLLEERNSVHLFCFLEECWVL